MWASKSDVCTSFIGRDIIPQKIKNLVLTTTTTKTTTTKNLQKLFDMLQNFHYKYI